jgi:hypothetical protein
MLVILPGPRNALRAAEPVPATSPSSNAITASLEYQEANYSVNTWGVALTTQTVFFKKEPPAASGKIIRGLMNFGGDSSNAIPFLWQRDARKLFLDLNRNRDLTDDPSGVYSSVPALPVNYQTFTNVHLPFNTPSGSRRVLTDITLYDYGAQPNCFLAVRSFWQGKLALSGQDWQVGILEDAWGRFGSFDNSRLLLRPWEKRNQPFNVGDGLLDTVPFSRKLFVGGHAWQVEEIARSQNGEAGPALQFTEQSVALGELKITGQFIGRLVLGGGQYLVILDQPAGVVKVPTGSYNQPDVRLEHNGAGAFTRPGQPQGGGRISVDGKTPALLNAGGPLTNSVTASRQGADLHLDYLLVGAGGGTYQLAKQDTSKPPQFAVYQGDKKIGSGDFEFG